MTNEKEGRGCTCGKVGCAACCCSWALSPFIPAAIVIPAAPEVWLAEKAMPLLDPDKIKRLGVLKDLIIAAGAAYLASSANASEFTETSLSILATVHAFSAIILTERLNR